MDRPISPPWFRWLDLGLERQSIIPARLSYERDLAPDPVAASAALAARFRLPFSPAPVLPMMQRQDLEPDFRDRVANWEAFAADADPELLAWATAAEPPNRFHSTAAGTA